MRKKNINHTYYASDCQIASFLFSSGETYSNGILYILMSDISENKNIFEEENYHKLFDF